MSNILVGMVRCQNGVKINRKSRKGFKHSSESKVKMSLSRKNWLRNNADKSAWRSIKMSYPEKLFYNKIKEKNLDDKYLIIRERSVYPYYVDFAFENEKVAIEIDGSQHLLEERKKLDDKKDTLLSQEGWRILRITAYEIIFNIDYAFSKVLDFIKSDVRYKLFSKKCECGNSIDSQSTQCISCRSFKRRKVIDRPDREFLINLVKEIGYSAAGRIYNVSDNSIRKWIKIKNPSI